MRLVLSRVITIVALLLFIQMVTGDQISTFNNSSIIETYTEQNVSNFEIDLQNVAKNDMINEISIFADGDVVFFIGNVVNLSGYNTYTNTVYLYIVGSGVPENGGKLDDPSIPVIDGDPSSFTSVNVNPDESWSYLWDSSVLQATDNHFFIIAATEPRDLNHIEGQLNASIFAASTGLAEPIVEFPNLTGYQFFPLAVYPSRYDLRDYNRVTPVRDQLGWGTCWAHAALASLESTLTPNETWDFSEKNLVNMDGFDLDEDDGGTILMATAYLAKWGGPVAESDDPYPDWWRSGWWFGNSNEDLPEQKHIQDVLWLSQRSSPTDNDDIKWALSNYGGIYTVFYYDNFENYYDPINHCYYNPSGLNIKSGHAVTMVGWDDDYSRYRFIETPPGDGAFIVKNSWGSWWGENGYFYVSYYDANFGKYRNALVLGESKHNYVNIYQYDPLGLCKWDSQNWFANVFSAESDETLKAVSFYSYLPNTSYELYIYTEPQNGPLNYSGYTYTQKETIVIPGYRTIKLDSPVFLKENTRFSVIVKSDALGCPIETKVIEWDEWYSSKATANPGESYVSSDGVVWTDLTTIDPYANVCLKAFTDYGEPDFPDMTYLYLDTISDGHIGDMIEVSGSTNLDEATSLDITLQTDFSVNKIWKYHSTASVEGGKFSSEISSSEFAPGEWSATVNDTSGLYDTALFNLCPVQNITATPSSGCGPLTVQFSIDDFSNFTSFLWDLGDGEISTLLNPVHTYTESGTYTVTLSFCDNCECGNITTEIDVFPPPTADFSYENGQFTDSSTGNPFEWSWEFGDGTASTVQNPCHDYSHDGTYTVNLTVTNDCGSDSVSKNIQVPCPVPVADFTWDGSCFTDTSTNNPTSWNWEFGDGIASTVQNPCHDYSQDGTYTVNLTVTNDCGSDSVSKDITVQGSEEFFVLLNEGWNIFSTPVALDSDNSSFEDIFSATEQQKVLVVLGWDGNQWFIPNPSRQIDPLYAYFIKIKEESTATAILVPSKSITSLPSRQVISGINLVGPAPAYDENIHGFQAMPLDQSLTSIEYVGDLTGYIIVVSPNMNQPGWAYAKGGSLRELLPFKGYWVVMENGPDTLYGFSTTPV